MSAQKTKFPKKIVPARKIHQGTTIIGKNGLPVDALATIEPGTTLVSGASFTISYTAPTITINGAADLSVLANFNISQAQHTGLLLFTDSTGADYFIDPNSIDNVGKTFDIYTDEDLTTSPATVDTAVGWLASEAELVNRLQTTSSAVIDTVEFRDIDIKFNLDGDPVSIVDDDGDKLDILPDGSIPVTISPITTPTIANVPTPAANTEYSYLLPTGTKKIRISARGNAKLIIYFSSGAIDFITIFPGNVYEESDLSATITVYFQANKSGEVVEILSWK